MPFSRSNFYTAVIEDKLFTFGGYNEDEPAGNYGETMSNVECFYPDAPEGPAWYNIEPMITPKSALGVAVISTYVEPCSYLDYLELNLLDVTPSSGGEEDTTTQTSPEDDDDSDEVDYSQDFILIS